MPKVHKSYRLEADTVDGVEAWAKDHGVTVTQAMDDMLSYVIENGMAERREDENAAKVDSLTSTVKDLTTQLEALKSVDEAQKAAAQAEAEAWDRQRETLGGNIRDLRAMVATLTAQVTEKDEQIRRLTDLADHAQMLQAAQVQQIAEATGERPDEGTEGEPTPMAGDSVAQAGGREAPGEAPEGIRQRLARWIAGR